MHYCTLHHGWGRSKNRMITTSLFKPAWWLPNGHLQTLWSSLKSRAYEVEKKREKIATPDGDFLHLDWSGSGHGPIVLILHGLAGSSDSNYIIGLQCAINNFGWRSVAINFRGCSGTPNLTTRGYHSGETEDIALVYNLIKQREPDTPLMAVGFSLGANVLLKWLGQTRQVDLIAAVAVSVPFLLGRCADRMDTGFSRIYQHKLISELKTYLHNKIENFQSLAMHDKAEYLEQLADLNSINNFWLFDHHITAPLHGFASGKDYYHRSSCRQYLSSIDRPTLIIQAKDDPFMTPDVIPSEEELSPSVTLELSQQGGHVGFVQGHNPFQPKYWLDIRITQWLKQTTALQVL